MFQVIICKYVYMVHNITILQVNKKEKEKNKSYDNNSK